MKKLFANILATIVLMETVSVPIALATQSVQIEN